ncbi:MAG: hypothetical protein L6Q59_17335, partial [Ignavibacteriaceae bacterium]|nr:hypothetical protein [Ignavibacteriaceae bacterium]
EYDAVLLSLVREADLSFLISPELGNKEEHRIYYVAISRAKRNLYISVPTLSKENEQKMKELGFQILRLKAEETERCSEISNGVSPLISSKMKNL